MGSGRDILPPIPWASYSALTDPDLKAIFAYLKTIPAVANKVPDPIRLPANDKCPLNKTNTLRTIDVFLAIG